LRVFCNLGFFWRADIWIECTVWTLLDLDAGLDLTFVGEEGGSDTLVDVCGLWNFNINYTKLVGQQGRKAPLDGGT
jgi:hypothetical protein